MNKQIQTDNNNNKINWLKVTEYVKNGKLINLVYHPYSKNETIVMIVDNDYKSVFGQIASTLRKDKNKGESMIEFTDPKTKNLIQITYEKEYKKYNKYGELVNREYLLKYGHDTESLIYTGKYNVNMKISPSRYKLNISYMLGSNYCPNYVNVTEERFLSLLEKVL